MKRLLIILAAIFSFAGIQAQYLNNGDVVSICFIANDVRYYLEASGNGILTQPYPTDDCLWVLGVDQNGNYTLQDLTTKQYLFINFTDPSNSSLILAQEPTAFSFNNQGSVANQYMYGHLYYSRYYEPWWTTISMYIDSEWGASGPYFTSHSWTNNSIYVEKWEQKGAGKPTGHFSPSKIEFTYAESDAEAAAQARDVTFMIEATTESYYQCVPRQDEALLRRSTGNVDEGQILVTNIYWESSKGKSSNLDVSKYVAHQDANRTLMTISDPISQDSQWKFSITPKGPSPMGLKDKLGTLERWIDYADNVVVEYTYGGGETQTAEMRVVRKAYHGEELPTISFSINPVTYTFSQEGTETKQFDVTLTHQHGSVIYNVDNQAIITNCTYGPVHVKLNKFHEHFTGEDAWEKTPRFLGGANWLKLDNDEFQSNGNIYIKADPNTSGLKRSDTLVVVMEKTAGEDAHLHKDSFMIPLHQRGMEGGIKFKVNKGQSGDALDSDGRQQVHTAERTIYYLPNQEIELRLPESGFSGYMRWYDYETNGDPYYNYAHGKDSTHWVLSPRAANGNPFSAINTPASSNTINTEGYSYGLYAINKANGGILDEGNPYNPMPIIKGWNSGAAHTMACDVSAYTDYTIWTHPTNRTRIDSIQEPTLSYRQLFHLRPASEMADTLAARSSRGVYLEEYKYQAPAGKQILLSTEYRHSKVRSHKSELCYFYRDNSGNIKQIDNRNNDVLVWRELDKNGTYIQDHTPQYSAEMDYLIVRNDNYLYEEPKVYALVLPAGDNHPEYLIARFEVEFVDIERQGPTSKTIITQQRINTQYKNLAEINFNNTTGHLPWEQASYGYVYTTGNLVTQFKRGADQGAFPFYGEYTVLESVNKDWARASAHGGTGKSLYVDGTMEPGLVASITAPSKICSGQTMYCSAWFCNPAPSGWSGEGNPIFRCNIQGKNTDEQEWHDVGVYFVGELLKGSGWQQIVFPIQTASSYEQTRVSIYNFATTNQGNDFMVDDITLFVSQLPIAAYQGEMACRTVEDGTSSAVAVLRLDYNNITAGSDGYMYYQIYNELYENKENGEVVSTGAAVNLTGDAGYYHDYDDEHGGLDHDHPYGSVHIPEKGFDPEVYNKTAENKVLIHTSVSAFLDDLVLNNQKHGKAYIRTEQSGVIKWLLYIAHIVENATQEDINNAPDADRDSIPLKKLFDEHSYVMRMAYTPEELPTAECNLTTPLHATQQTVFKLRNSDKQTITHTEIGEANNGGEEMYIHTKSTNNCPNDFYSLTSTVVNYLSVSGVGGNTENIPAPIFSDWLIGDPKGDVLSEKAPSRSDYNTDNEYQTALTDYNARLQAAITGFKDMYGYTHDEVTSAIMYDMRRFVTNDPNSPEYNPNHQAKSFEELRMDKFLSLENYEIIKHLCDNGLLQLYDTTVHFYLGTRLNKNHEIIGDTARYWCFPIAETAKATVTVDGKDTEITLKDCNEPHRVTVSIAGGDHYLNIAPIEYANKTAQQSVQLPTLKVLEGSETITIPITEISNQIKTDGADLTNKEITLSLGDLTYFNLETGEPYQEKPTTLEVGNEHTIRLTMKNASTSEESDPSATCRYGYVFLKLQIVPQTLVWSPSGTSFNGWGKDENWKGWVDTNSNNQIDEGELVEGFVPMPEANVIIPKLDNALLYPFIVPEHEHSHYPLTINAEPHHCNNIYFAPEAKIHNQHLLHYEKAFVDMQITAGKWNMMSAPLKKMVSGDMFIPHTGKYNDLGAGLKAEPNPFEVSEFQGLRHRDAAYLFYQHFYNQTVYSHYEDGGTTSAASIGFEESNSLSQPLQAGGGYSLYGVGMEGKETLTIRLPKPDTEYYYYTSTGVQSTNKTSVDRGENNESYRLAFDAPHDAEHADQKMEIRLTNHTATDRFLFGNPTMAYIDMKLFLENNSAVLNPVFHRIEGSVWTASTELSMHEDRYLAPMTSVLLETKDKIAHDTITVTLSADHLTLNNTVNTIAEEPENDTQRLIASSPDNHTSELLTIYAFTPKATARTVLATNPVANDYFVQGEDALFVSSGIENNTSVKSPLNMYTAAEQVPMMADVRQGVSQIPLSILADTKVRTDYMQLAFYYTSNWTRTCYLVDNYTGQKIRIMNGLIISVEMPQNHEQRYYIEGPDEYIGSSNNEGGGVATSTSSEIKSTDESSLNAFSVNPNELNVVASSLMREVKIYDMTGRLIADKVLSLFHTTTTITVPSGICVVEAILRDGTSLHTQAIVR